MSSHPHRKPADAHYSDRYPSTYMGNKGLPTTTRQQNEPTKTRPGSNFIDKRQMRKAVDAPRSVNQQNYVKTQENPKFQELMQRIQTSKEVGSKMHPSSAQRRAVDVPKIRCVKFNNNADFDDSEPETEIDSLYDNTNFHEAQSESLNSESEYEGEFDDSFESLQNGIKTITNKYVQKVQSRVDNAMSKLKLQEKVKHAKPPKKVVGERGAGDIKSIRNEEVYKKMEAVKKECYRKIEANLTILKHIDTINDELFLSRMSKKD